MAQAGYSKWAIREPGAYHDLIRAVYRYRLVIPGSAVAMRDAGRAMRARLGQFAAARPGLVARLRLFGLLILIVPLFAGLQYMIGERFARVEVQFVSQDVPIFVPVERVVERDVERIVYVPVPYDATPEPASPTPTDQPAGTPTPTGADPRGVGAPVGVKPAPGD
jgi:hypothetical protein